MTTHSVLSPSSRHRWGKCAGSIREESKYPEQPSGKASIDGTHTHTLLDHCLRQPLDDSALMFIGRTLTDHEGSFVVDKERAERVNVVLDYIGLQLSEAEKRGVTGVVLSESRVDPAHLLGRDDLAGTVDVQLHMGDVVEIIDLKDGMNPVSAEDNPQMVQYALGVLAGYKLPVNGDYPVKTFRMTIIQPKLALKGLPPVSSWDISTHDLIAFKIGEVAAQAKATDDPDAPLVPGESQCKYCRAKGACSALAGKAMSDVGVMFGAVAPVSQPFDIAQQSADKDPATMSNEQIRSIMEAAPLLRQLLNSVDEEALRRVKTGVTIPGLKAVYGRGSQAWNQDAEATAALLKKMGVPKDAVYVTNVVSPAQAKKLTWTKRDGTQKQLSERQLKTLEKEYISKLGGKLTVVPESDPRPAVTLDATPLFKAVEAPVVEATLELPSWLIAQ